MGRATAENSKGFHANSGESEVDESDPLIQQVKKAVLIAHCCTLEQQSQQSLCHTLPIDDTLVLGITPFTPTEYWLSQQQSPSRWNCGLQILYLKPNTDQTEALRTISFWHNNAKPGKGRFDFRDTPGKATPLDLSCQLRIFQHKPLRGWQTFLERAVKNSQSGTHIHEEKLLYLLRSRCPVEAPASFGRILELPAEEEAYLRLIQQYMVS